MDSYGNGRQAVIDEIRHYIESELGKIQFEKRQIPDSTKDIQLTHKRATLAGVTITLSKLKQLLKKKEDRMKLLVKKQQSLLDEMDNYLTPTK